MTFDKCPRCASDRIRTDTYRVGYMKTELATCVACGWFAQLDTFPLSTEEVCG